MEQNLEDVLFKEATPELFPLIISMLRSAFRAKQPADSTAKEEKQGASGHGRSRFFFHLETEGQDSREDHISDVHENLNTISAEAGVSYNESDGELHLDCNHEFLESTQSSSSDKESVNEEDKTAKGMSGKSVGNTANEEMKDQRKGSFSNSERQIYEMQLAQLQEQLVNTMIDYQDMSEY